MRTRIANKGNDHNGGTYILYLSDGVEDKSAERTKKTTFWVVRVRVQVLLERI